MRDGIVIETPEVSKMEQKILDVLEAADGKLVRYQDFADAIWGGFGGEQAVRVHVSRLRTKIGTSRIVTVRGFGYRLLPA